MRAKAFLKSLISSCLIIVLTVGFLGMANAAELNVERNGTSLKNTLNSIDITDYFSGPEVTRAQWLAALVNVLELAVEDDNYPDNYFSDLSGESAYYREMLIAAGYGLIDVEAGDPMYPDEPATREFVAHSTNLLLCYFLEDNTEYTFSDAENAVYPVDDQVAVNLEWLALLDGQFQPGSNITVDEATHILQEAKNVWDSTSVEDMAANIQLADSVINIPEGTEVEITDDQVTIFDSPVSINEGDVFCVTMAGSPRAYVANSVRTEGNATVIETSIAQAEDAFDVLEVSQHITEMELMEEEVEPFSVSTSHVSPMGIPEMIALQSSNAAPIIKNKSFQAGAYQVALGLSLSNYSFDHYHSFWKQTAFAVWEGDYALTYTFTANAAKALGSNSWPLVSLSIFGVARFNVRAIADVTGSVSGHIQGHLKLGLEYYKGTIRLIHMITVKPYENIFNVNGDVGMQVDLSLSNIPGISGSAFAKAGVSYNYSDRKYYDGKTPKSCQNVETYFYANMGAAASIHIGDLINKPYNAHETIYGPTNSPWISNIHYEDYKRVDKCSRGNDYKYYTSGTSKLRNNTLLGATSDYSSSGIIEPTFEYVLDEDNKATITEYHGNVSMVRIPEEIDGYEVIGLGAGLFTDDTHVKKLIIPNTVTEMGYGALDNGALAYSSIETVVFEEGRSSIPSIALLNAEEVKTVQLPEGITLIEGSAFENCKSLKHIELPESLTELWGGVFSGCTSLQEISIPENVTSIGDGAFYGCETLTEIVIPKHVTHMGHSVIGGCTGIKELEIPKSVKEMGSLYGTSLGSLQDSYVEKVIFETGRTEIPQMALQNAEHVKEVVIPETVTTIASSAFSGCTALEQIDLPDNLTELWGYVFSGCTSLQEILIPENVASIGDGAFYGCETLTEIVIPKHVTHIGHSVIGGCTGIKELEIPKSVKEMEGSLYGTSLGSLQDSYVEKVIFETGRTEIPQMALQNAEHVKEVLIPDTVTIIGSSAFSGCTALEHIDLPERLTELYPNAFSECLKLKDILIPEGVTFIGNGAFYDCKTLSTIIIPDQVIDIGTGAFEGCTALSQVSIGKGLPYLPGYMFYGCSSLKTFECPQNINEIREEAFHGCSSLETITLSDALETIKWSAFYDCDSLSDISIPDSVKMLQEEAFYDCDSLKTVKLSTGLTGIAESTFEHCDALETIVLPYRVTEIGDRSFKNCINLKSITIPRSVESIGEEVFSYPNKMTIYGVEGTYAETYANENDIRFVAQEIHAEAASFQEKAMTVDTYGEYKLVLSVTPENFTDEVTWKSTNPDVASIEDDGTLYTYEKGTATINATVGNVSATCKITVVQPVTDVWISSSEEYMEALETRQLYAEALPSDAESIAVTWKSSDESVASVDENGLVTAHKKGIATITATSVANETISADCVINVTNETYICQTAADMESPHNYANNCTDYWIYQTKNAETIKVTFDERTELEDGFDYLNIYDENDELVGSYTGNGLAGQTVSVTGGIVKIQLVSDDSGNAWGFKVTKISSGEVEDIQLNKTSVEMDEGSSLQLNATISPSEISNKKVIWTSSDPSVARVSSAGKVTAVSTGTAIITAAADADKNMTATCEIAVKHVLSHKAGREATCETEGEMEYWTCAVCGKIFADEGGSVEISEADTVLPAKGHDWGEWVVTKEATETEIGEETRTCKNDAAHKETRTVPVITHEHTLKIVEAIEPTCEEAGSVEHWTCTECGKLFADEYAEEQLYSEDIFIPAKGHDWSEWIVTKEASETEEGKEVRTCKNDAAHTETRSIPVIGHVHTLNMVEEKGAGCEEAGNAAYWICIDCGRYFLDETGLTEVNPEETVIPAAGHIAADPVKENEIEADCTTGGSYDNVRYCSVCGKEMSREHILTSVRGHDWAEPLWDWSDDFSQAIAEFQCRNNAQHTERIAASVNRVIIKEATAAEKGEEQYTAKVSFNKKDYSDVQTKEIPPVGIAVTGVKLNKASATLEIGESFTLAETITPANASNKAVSWKSSNSKVAAVDEYGMVEAVGSGTAVITVTTEDGGFTATCNITVKAVLPTKMTLNKTSAELATKKTLQLKATIEPSNVTDASVTWTSSNPEVATVDQNGKVTALIYGTTTIKAVSNANGKVKASCSIQTRFSDATKSNVNTEMFKAIYWFADKKITGNTVTYGTKNSMTRGQFVTFLWRLAGKPKAKTTKNPFKDLTKSNSHYKSIMWAVGAGLINGYSNGKFGVDDPLTRNNVATILWKYAGSPKVSKSAKSPFSDAKGTAIIWGASKKILTSTDGKFYPKNKCTRGDFAVFLYRYNQKVK